MITVQDVLDQLNTGKPIQPLVMEEKEHPEYPNMVIVSESQCSTTMPNGARCDGVDHLVRRNLPVGMDLSRALTVLVMILVMCMLSSLLAMRRLIDADPAEIF